MSFLSGLKRVGKVALKVAPFAAMAIPGIGPLASMAIQGGIGAAQGALGGGGLKGALLGGAMGAGTSALAGKIPGLDKIPGLGKGIGPSTSVVKNAVDSTAGKALNKGLGSKILDFGVKTASNAGLGSTKGEITKGVLSKIPQIMASRSQAPTPVEETGASPSGLMPRLGAMPAPSDQYPGGFGPNFSEDQNNPNLANAINQGKLDAQRYRRPQMMPLQRQYGYNG